MTLYHLFIEWMAKRQRVKMKLQQALWWYDRWGANRMESTDLIDYAGLLHESEQTERAIKVLSELLTRHKLPVAYERRAHIYNELGMKAEALADLDEAIRLDPKPYIYWYTRAVTHYDHEEYEPAVNDFMQALSRREDSKASTYYELGNVYMKLGCYKEAEASFSEATANISSVIPHYFYRRAQALEQLEQLPTAFAILNEGIDLHDKWLTLPDQGASILKERTNYSNAAVASFIKGAQDEYGFRLYAAALLEAMGEDEQALASLNEAIARNPYAAELQLRKGVLLRRLERYSESIAVLKAVTIRNPLWLPAYMELSTTYRMIDNVEEVIRTLRVAKEHYPDHTVVSYWLADAYREGSMSEEAMLENRKLIALEPEDPLNWKQCAEIAIDADRYQEADEAYTKALKLEENVDFYMRRSFSRYMIDRYEEAMLDIQSAAKLDHNLLKQSKTAYALGELYVGMENWTFAEAEYSKALALEPDNSIIYDRRARCRFAAERYTDALEDCNKGLLLDTTNVRLIWLRGLIHYRLDDLEAALADSTTYLSLLPGDTQGHYNHGLIYKQLNRYDEAHASFTKVLELNPFEASAYLERASLRYHHFFDRVQAADDLAQWLLYAGGESSEEERFLLLTEIRGFDDEMRERAKEQFLLTYGSNRYLS